MRLNVSTSIDVTAREKAGDNLLFLGFHGFSNDENEMIRIIDAIYDVPKQDASSTDNSIAPAQTFQTSDGINIVATRHLL